MPCSQCQGIESLFDARTARRDLRRYRRKGPAKATRALIEALVAEGVAGASLLDVGGGVGMVQQELLAAGAERAVSVDAAFAYVEAAREEAARRGTAERVRFELGDFVELAPSIPAADVVTLDKAICCYPDVERLVALSSERAGRLYGLVYPQERWYVRLGAAVVNALLALRRSRFRVFVHPSDLVGRIVAENGLAERFSRRVGPIWQVAVYGR